MEDALATLGFLASQHDRAKAIQEFLESKGGVKAIADSGTAKIPEIFIHEEKTLYEYPTNKNPQVPLIDLDGLEKSEKRSVIVDQIRQASETWGFFQIINHGIPVEVMDKLLECHKKFHEQPIEVKKQFYSLNPDKTVWFSSNAYLQKQEGAAGDWKDTLFIVCQDDKLDPNSLPAICSEAVVSYMQYMSKAKETLSGLLSEALGLSEDYLSKCEYMKYSHLTLQYYPTCPEPHLTLGVVKHSDPSFVTILLQDASGGLQVLHQNQWHDVIPIEGALVVNIGDYLQIASNGRFKSVEHRALAPNSNAPRLSAVCFFHQHYTAAPKPYGPIKEILSDSNPPMYREFFAKEYLTAFYSKWRDGNQALSDFQI